MVGPVKPNWASRMAVSAFVGPIAWRMSHSACDQIWPSSWTSPIRSSG